MGGWRGGCGTSMWWWCAANPDDLDAALQLFQTAESALTDELKVSETMHSIQTLHTTGCVCVCVCAAIARGADRDGCVGG